MQCPVKSATWCKRATSGPFSSISCGNSWPAIVYRKRIWLSMDLSIPKTLGATPWQRRNQQLPNPLRRQPPKLLPQPPRKLRRNPKARASSSCNSGNSGKRGAIFAPRCFLGADSGLDSVDRVVHRTDFHDLRFHRIARFEEFGRCTPHADARRRSCRDHIARIERKTP